MKFVRKMLKDNKGATAIEYGLIASLIALAIVAGVGAFADSLEQLWNGNNSKIAKSLATH